MKKNNNLEKEDRGGGVVGDDGVAEAADGVQNASVQK